MKDLQANGPFNAAVTAQNGGVQYEASDDVSGLFFCIQADTETVITTIVYEDDNYSLKAADNSTLITSLTIPAGTVKYINVTSFTVSSGTGTAYTK